jgi:hypothetical protein
MIKDYHVSGRAFVFEREPKGRNKVFSRVLAGRSKSWQPLCFAELTAGGNSLYVREKGSVVPWMIHIFLFIVTHQSFD